MTTPPIEKRLARQLAAKGVKGAANMAEGLLEKRGQLKDGKLTAEGKARQALGNGGRAKDRAVKASTQPHTASDYDYNAKTNKATLK